MATLAQARRAAKEGERKLKQAQQRDRDAQARHLRGQRGRLQDRHGPNAEAELKKLKTHAETAATATASAERELTEAIEERGEMYIQSLDGELERRRAELELDGQAS